MSWQDSIEGEWTRRVAAAPPPAAAFPLMEQTFRPDEIVAMTEVLLSGQLTMSKRVAEFEEKFAAFVGAPFAVMVNSGSSANLLATAVATNPMRAHRLAAGDEVLVPAVCWSTSVWPLIQMNLKPIFVDVDPRTLNVDMADLKRKVSPRTRGYLAVHILGNCAPIDGLKKIVEEHDLILIEDTCESLGSRWRGRTLGTFGDFGTYSFFFSHHMTTGEGGMVVCKTRGDYDLLKCLRAHGWSRELSNRTELEREHADIDPRFLFVNVGYNLRPMEIQAALGLKQLERLPAMNEAREANAEGLREALRGHARWREQFLFPETPAGASPVWFGFPALLSDRGPVDRATFLASLGRHGVENRPVVSGNFARQPGLGLFNDRPRATEFVGAERVHHDGFFIGLPSQILSSDRLKDLAHRMISAHPGQGATEGPRGS